MNKRFLCTRWLYLCLIGNVLLNTITASAQCGCAYRFETTFPAAVKEAPVVIEGELLHSGMVTFGGDPTYLGDYKSTKIKVYKVLKGNVNAEEVELIQPHQHCSDCCIPIGFSDGVAIGIFFLYPSETIETPRNEIPNSLKFQYNTTWGCNFLNYNTIVIQNSENPIIYNPYGIYGLNDINNKVYQVAKSITGQKYKEITPIEKKHLGGGTDAKEADSQATAITSISPTTITAG